MRNLKKYKCVECGRIFSEEEICEHREPHGEEIFTSPCCGEAFEEMNICVFCGEYHCNEIDCCDDCKKSIFKKFKSLFTEDERDVIGENWEEMENFENE